jgi:RNA polymerase sporulation-specific sigma factor
VQHGYLSIIKAINMYKLEPLEREIVERHYILGQTLGEIACDRDKSYHQFVRIKKKALEKLRALM